MNHRRLTVLRALGACAMTICAGAAGGVIGSSVTNGSLETFADRLFRSAGPVSFPSGERPVRLLEGDEDRLAMLREVALPTVVRIYTSPIDREDFDSSIPTARGILLTSDGWVAAAPFFLAESEEATLSVLSGQTFYPITAVVADPASETVFLKMAASNLPVAAFGTTSRLEPGEPIFVLPSDKEILPMAFRGWNGTEGRSVSVDVPHRFLFLSGEVLAPGSPVFNQQGAFIGLTSGKKESDAPTQAIPVETFQGPLRSLLQTGEIQRPFLGVRGTDLSQAPGVVLEGRTRGMLVDVVEKGSPAEKADIRSGDVIVEVGGRPIYREASLERFLAFAQPGELWILGLERDGVTLEVEVILETLALLP
ncbi:MAG TPA: S1C family serine protease [Patescibacteria group bacterium]|nr:S1C family serine protease [Patescibacteria group bacterium]